MDVDSLAVLFKSAATRVDPTARRVGQSRRPVMLARVALEPSAGVMLRMTGDSYSATWADLAGRRCHSVGDGWH